MSEIKIRPREIVRFLVGVVIVLLVLHGVSYVPLARGMRAAPVQLLNLDGERSLPALFSTSLLWLNAVLTGGIAWGGTHTRLKRFHWAGLSAAFLFMGIDESVCLHERLMDLIRHNWTLHGLFFFAWVIPYSVLALVFGAVYLKFLFQLPPETRKRLVLAAALYLGGALGVEMVNGAWAETHGLENVAYYVMVTVEELLELSGGIAFVYTFSTYMDQHLPDLRAWITSS